MLKVFQSKFIPKKSIQNSAYTVLEYFEMILFYKIIRFGTATQLNCLIFLLKIGKMF